MLDCLIATWPSQPGGGGSLQHLLLRCLSEVHKPDFAMGCVLREAVDLQRQRTARLSGDRWRQQPWWQRPTVASVQTGCTE